MGGPAFDFRWHHHRVGAPFSSRSLRRAGTTNVRGSSSAEAITADPGGKNGTVSYTQYDAVGNRQGMTSTLNAVPGGSFSYDNNDRLTTDTYDNNGNTMSQAGIANTYDFENRMLTHGAVTLVYDGDGNRVWETVGGSTTKYLVDNLNPTGLPQVMDERLNSAVSRTYAYGLQRISENQKISNTWTPSFYGYDGHGNVRFLANKTGSITDSYDYDAFGMPIRTSGTTPNVFQYSGERLDSSIGLYDLRARYYNQATGRFWIRDPIEGKKCCGLSWNPYIYVRQNPTNAIDPTGRGILETGAIDYSVGLEAVTDISVELYAGAQQFASAAQLYGTVAYLTLQDFLALVAAAAHTSGAEKLIACSAVSVIYTRFLEEHSSHVTTYDELLAEIAIGGVCGLYYPGPDLPPSSGK